MKFTPLATAALTASGLILAGCSSISGARLYLENYRAPGIPQESFGVGEMPAIVVEAQAMPEATERVTRVADGRIVLQHAIRPLPARGSDTGPEANHFLLPDLAVGEYTAELWSQGRLIDHMGFSITDKPATMTYEMAHQWRPAPPLAGTRHFASDLNELNALLGLSPKQKDEISRLLAAENAALPQAAPSEMGTIVQKTKADIRALLTPEQQHLYDNVNGSLPRALGRENQRKSRLIELQNTLGLSPEQNEKIARLLAAEADSRAQLLPGTELAQVTQKTEADIRTLLTPEQQLRFDREPKPHSVDTEQKRAAEAFVSEYLKKCPAILSRDGEVADVRLTRDNFQTSPGRESGGGVYEVKGGTRSETFKVYWEKLRSGPIRILKIEAANGEIIPID